jgi:prevent-host-death family protein
MEDVDLRHAKEHLEELIERARRGEDVRISDPALGSVRLVPAGQSQDAASLFPKRIPGLMKGMASIPDEKLFEPLSEEELAWLSGETSP